MQLAIFDFDGTITKKDSLIEFIRFAVGGKKFILGLIRLTPILILFTIKVVSNVKVKEVVLSYFFKGWDLDRFNETASNYSRNRLSEIIKKSALDKINWHKEQGHVVTVVSATIENYLIDWCQQQEIDFIATKLEIKDGRLTGKLVGKNCRGIEKVRRIREKYNLSQFDCVYAYGDSRADKELKTIADKFFFRAFQI